MLRCCHLRKSEIFQPNAEEIKLCRLMASARSWLNRARGVRQARTPLKKMREVLHSGQRLGTNLAEVEDLRSDIRRREWEESAKRVSETLLQNNPLW